MSRSSEIIDGTTAPALKRSCFGETSFGKPSFNAATQSIQPQTKSPASSRIMIKLPGEQLARTVPFTLSRESTFASAMLGSSESTSRSAAVLQQMFETGKYSDLTVIANDGKEFRVHSAVVLPASDVLASEYQSNKWDVERLELSQTPEVTESILRHTYAMDVPILSATLPAQDASLMHVHDAVAGAVLQRRVEDIEMLLGAAVQYGMNDLAAATLTSFSNALGQCHDLPAVLASAAASLYARNASRIVEEARHLALQAIVPALSQVMNDQQAKGWLLASPDLIRDVLTLAGQRIAEQPKPVRSKAPSLVAPLFSPPGSQTRVEDPWHNGQKRRAASPAGSESNKRQKTGTE